jgi:pimeloyl-ACP methyl ester carboxylesterase
VLLGRRSVLRALSRIRCPVLLLHGEADPLVRVGSARRVAAAHPRWGFVVVPRVGHVPMLEDPVFTLRELGDWLVELAAPAPSGYRKVDASSWGTHQPRR